MLGDIDNGQGLQEGMDLHADNIKPKELGGEAEISMG